MSGGNEQERFDETLQAALAHLQIETAPAQRELMFRHYALVVQANRHINLTRIVSPEDAAVKHYADSLAVFKVPGLHRDSPAAMLDVGTGAGFPAVPLAIACPQWKLTAIDGTGKKIRFVKQSIDTLQLANLRAFHARAESLPSIMRHAHMRMPRWDAILLRAVADLKSGLNELAKLPTRQIIFYKSARIDTSELQGGADAATLLGFNLTQPIRVDIPFQNEMLERLFITYEKRASRSGGSASF